MELLSEKRVTELLVSKEIINVSTKPCMIENNVSTLGHFLEKVKNTPSLYAGRYIFIR